MLVHEQQKNIGKVIAKAWSDPIFKERLKTNPKNILTDMGVETPDGIDIEVVENTEKKMYLTLPVTPLFDALSDEDIVGVVEPRGISPIAASTTVDSCDSCRAGC